MKKVLAILLAVLILAAMLPLGMTAKAETATQQPFYGLGWSDIDETKFPNLDGVPTASFGLKDGRVTLSYKEQTGVAIMARKLKTEMDKRPEGMRYLHLWNMYRMLGDQPEDVVYLHDKVGQMKALVDALLAEYKSRGGQLDGIVIDVEYVQMGSWYVYINEYYQKDANGKKVVTNPNIYNEIVANPRYATEIRPLLAERGFTFNTTDPDAQNVDGKPKSELWGIWPNQRKSAADKATYANCEAIWNAVMRNRLNAYMNEAFFEPLLKYYPDATLSDYQSQDTEAWRKNLEDTGGEVYLGGNRDKVGNVSNMNSYSHRPANAFYETGYVNLKASNKAFYEDDPYNMFLFDNNKFKDMYAATDTKKVSFWIAEYDYEYSYNAERTGTVSNTPYYSETILHMGLLNPEQFLVYMYRPEFDTQEEYDKACRVISELLAELTRVAGWSDRKPIEIPANWNDGYVLSGMYAGGRNIWRITPDTTDGVSLTSFKTKDSDPTFSINGKTITFPGGKIIADSTISVVGTCGYWVETAADVSPVITTDANRYANNPSYSEDFSAYKNGTVFGDVASYWSVSGTVLKVQDNALALNGNAIVKNVTVPENITAGDSYAKQQMWEASFTLQAAMSDNEIVRLLTCDDDVGVQIQGNKIYYNKTVQLGTETLSVGTKYTVRREMDFANKKCTYYLLNGSTVLGKSESVWISADKDKATQIGFAAHGLTSEKVLIDDYKLYPMGLTTDFELYNAATGMQIPNARTNLKQIAYRLSWLNATDSAVKVNVMVQYGNEKAYAVRELVMQPGCDAVVTGIVENSMSNSVQVYLSEAEEFAPPVSEDPTNPTDTTDPTAPSDPADTTVPTVPLNPDDAADPVPSDPSAATGAPADPDTTEDGKTPDKSKGLSGGVIALIAIGVVLVAAGAGIGICYLVAKESFLATVKKIFRK